MKKQKIYTLMTVALLSTSVLSNGTLVQNNYHANATTVSKSGLKNVVISSNDYSKYFTAHGSASISAELATLTENKENKAGNTILNTKMSLSESFTLNGLVNLGSKGQGKGGDGISFIFQPDENAIGGTGGAMGFGGVDGSFGFKLDTFFNGSSGPGYSGDPKQFATSDNGSPAAFGAFVNGTSGTAITLEDTAQQISAPSNDEFKAISVSYNGSTKTMTVSYDGKTWLQDVTTMLGDNDNLAFSISASTGASTNLQQFKLSSFEYTVAQGRTVAHYVDEKRQKISDDVQKSGDLSSSWQTEQKDIPNYTFKEVQGDVSGIFTSTPQEVTYVYNHNEGKVISHYVDENGKSLAKDIEQIGEIDSPWQTEQKDIPDYTFKEVQGDTSGFYASTLQEVTYVYRHNQGEVFVTYTDDTTGAVLWSDSLSGNTGDNIDYSTAEMIKNDESLGFELISDDYPTGKITFTDKAQHYNVHLKHHMVVVNSEHPVEPGSPIHPDDSKSPVWPDGTDLSSLSHTVQEVVHYVYQDKTKASEDVTEKIEFKHEFIVDEVTGEVTDDKGWQSNKDFFSEKKSPQLKGYTADPLSIKKIDGLTSSSKSIEKTVVYTKNVTPPSSVKHSTTGDSKKQTTSDNKKKGLPQTGDQNLLSIIGTAVGFSMLMIGLFLVNLRRKMKK